MRFDASRPAAALACVWWVALVAAVLAWRPLTAVDETRYATVAWEMWLSGDAISLRLNGALYGDKPPLLFWLINLGWWAAGPSAWWPQLLTSLFALGALAVTLYLARQLAPGHDAIAAMALLISASTLFWMAFTGAVMFDIVLTFFVLIGVAAVVRAASNGGWRPWCVAGAAIGLGILTKGPVALLHVLPLALLAPWWRHHVATRPAARVGWGRWYAGVALAVLIAAALALAWAVPAAMAGGDAFGREIFWSQSADRVASTTHHLRPPWFYVVALPVLVLPWLFLVSVWRGAVALARDDTPALPGLRVTIAWLVPVVVVFSLFRGKQPQYLLPEVPAIAFLVACALNALAAVRRWESWLMAALFALFAALLLVWVRRPDAGHLVPPQHADTIWLSAALWLALALAVGWLAAGRPARAVAVVGTASVTLVVSGYAGVGRIALANYDVTPMAGRLAAVQAQGRPIAHFGKYHGQYQFVGRLQQPLQVIEQPQALHRWAADHPDGGVVVHSRAPPALTSGAVPEFAQKFKGGYVALWRAGDVLRAGPDGWRVLSNGAP